jgi:hypothetical protein
MSLIESVQRAEQTERDEALATCLEILRRNDRPRPDDGAALRAAMKVLHFAPERLASDLKVLQDAARLEQEAAADGPALASEVETAGAALREHLDVMNQQARGAESKRQELAGVLSDLQHKQHAARQARNRLAVLRRQHAALFGDEPQAAAPEGGFRQIVGAWPPDEPTAELAAAQRPVGLAAPQNWR